MDREDAILVRLIGVVCLAVLGCAAPPPDLPAIMLWTWERPEDLDFLADRPDVGVAHLVATVELHARDRFDVRPNRNVLRLPDEVARIAVVRVENVEGRPVVSELDDVVRDRLVDALAGFALRLRASGLQLDFDALHSQRDLYRRLLVELRPRLPAGHGLGITALASWCVGDPWLEHLPPGTLDYAVPMLFRMGPDASKIRRFVHAGGEFTAERCRGDVGLSTDEPWPAVESGSRRWWFRPSAWSSPGPPRASPRRPETGLCRGLSPLHLHPSGRR